MMSRRTLVSLVLLACALAGLTYWFVRDRADDSAEVSRGADASSVGSESSATSPSIESFGDPRTRETIVSTQPPAPLDVGPAFGAEIVLLCTGEPDGAPLTGVVAYVWKPDASAWVVERRQHGDFDEEIVSAALVRTRGKKYVADELGRIRVPRDTEAFAVVAEVEGRAAFVRIDPEEPSPRVIVLAQRVRLDVRVRDTSGASVPGVDVVLRGLRWPKDLGRACTDASGRAALDVAVEMQAGDDVLRVVAVVPEPVEKRVRAGVAETQTVELVLPRSEPWNVTIVDDVGEALPLWGELSFSCPRDDVPRPCGVGAPLGLVTALVNGRATIAAAPRDADTFVELESQRGMWWIDAAHARDVQLRATHIDELLRLTLCNADGSPAANRNFAHWFEGFDQTHGFRGGGALRTDERGRAAIALDEAVPAGGRLFVYEESDPPQRAFVDCAALRTAPGPRVVLMPMELGLTGRVVNAAGTPVVGAGVSVSLADAARDDDSGGGATTDAAGRFRVFGLPAEQRELRVWVWRAAPIPLRAGSPSLHWGDRDVELRVDELGSIEGEVLLDRGASDALVVEARWPQGSANVRRSAVSARTWRDRDRLRFRFADLGAGDRDLVFTHTAWGSRRIDISGVRVEAGVVTRDPRTAPLDLRGAFDDERDPGLSPPVSFVDVNGAPIAEGLISCEYDTDSWGGVRGWMDGSARLPLRHARCAAYAPGFGIQIGDVPRTQPATWVLEPEPTIVVELATPESLRELVRAVRVEIELERGPFNITSRQEIAATLVDDRATLACLMGGTHEVDVHVVWVADGEEHGTFMPGTTIEVSEGARGELHVLKADTGAWEAALRKDGAPIPPR